MLLCMRTTLDIGDALFREAKNRAVAEGIPFREVVEKALRSYLGTPSKTRAYRLKWSAEGGGLQTGVSREDFESRERLHNLLDRLG